MQTMLHFYLPHVILSYIYSHYKKIHLKTVLLILLLIFKSIAGFTQKIDNIYFNLYTDSLKKGSYNYINVEGKMANGDIRPLDSTQLIFSASTGKFFGNSLWLPFETKEEKVNITVTSRQDKNQVLRKTIYIKKKNEDESLLTPAADIYEQRKPKGRRSGR